MAHSMAQMEKPETRGRKKLHHLEIHPAKNGGHMVMHHYHSERGYMEPATHVFGPEQGEEMMAHVMKHAKVNAPAGEKDEAAEAEEHKMAESADEEDA